MKLIKWLLTSGIGRSISAVFVLVMMPVVVVLAMKAFRSYLSPGLVSAMARDGTGLGGYASHAEFGNDCLHCHEPVHCLTASKCQSCHMDIAKERAGTEGLHAMLPGTDRCQTCHKEHRGREAVISEVGLANIDHEALTGFSLAAHTSAEDETPLVCADCHPNDVLAASDVDCVSCHLERQGTVAQAHVDRYGTDCALCHDGRGDGPTVFEHATVYVLDGAHTDTSCEACHLDRVYEGLASDCASCHDEPAYHAGQFGGDCARCHNTMAFAPAQLTQHTFQLDHGSATGDTSACTTCHPGTYTEQTCFGCHDHEPTALLAQHREAGLEDAEACAECHKTGLAGEVEGLRPLASSPQIPAAERPVSLNREEP